VNYFSTKFVENFNKQKSKNKQNVENHSRKKAKKVGFPQFHWKKQDRKMFKKQVEKPLLKRNLTSKKKEKTQETEKCFQKIKKAFFSKAKDIDFFLKIPYNYVAWLRNKLWRCHQ